MGPKFWCECGITVFGEKSRLSYLARSSRRKENVQRFFNSIQALLFCYCLKKNSIRANRSIFLVFSCLSFSVPFLYIARTKVVLTGLKPYKPRFMASVTVFKNGDKN